LEFAGVFGAQRLGLQPQAVMQRDDRAELRLRVARKKRFERSLAAVARALPGNFFYLRDEPRIQRRAAFCQLDRGDHPGIFRRRRNDSRAGPGSFPSGLDPTPPPATKQKHEKKRVAGGASCNCLKIKGQICNHERGNLEVASDSWREKEEEQGMKLRTGGGGRKCGKHKTYRSV